MLFRAFALFFVFASLRRISGKFPPTESYPYQQKLDSKGEVFLYWDYDDTYITMELHTKSTGWIGVGISPTGTMMGADIYVGWVKNGKGIITDRHGVENAFPPLDEVQNVELLLAKEGSGGWTVLKFRRTIDTCIEDDLQITSHTSSIIYAWGSQDPVGDELEPMDIHVAKGVKSLNFLGHLNLNKTAYPPGEQHQTFVVTSGEITLPLRETYYLCRVVPLPQVAEKHHIVMIEPVVQRGNEDFVHHLVLTLCAHPLPSSALVNRSGECYTTGAPIDDEKCVQPLAAWDQGNEAIRFPTEVGFPFGEEEDPKYLHLEIHYDNPDKLAGIVDDSGLLITYTSQLRKYDAGSFSTGHLMSELTMIIPPGAPSFPIGGYCSEKCIRDSMKSSNVEEIKIMAVMSHTHMLGRRITIRHFRNDRELPYLFNDASENFDKHLYYLNNEVEVKQGDSLRTVCYYDSRGRNNFTYGGLDIDSEMCLVYAFYYPRTQLSVCKTQPTIKSMTDILSGYGVNVRQLRPKPQVFKGQSWKMIQDNSVGKTVNQILNQQAWNETLISELNTQLESSRVMHICASGSSRRATFMNAEVVTHSYVPPPKDCNVTINVTLPGEAPRLFVYPGFMLIHLAMMYLMV